MKHDQASAELASKLGWSLRGVTKLASFALSFTVADSCHPHGAWTEQESRISSWLIRAFSCLFLRSCLFSMVGSCNGLMLSLTRLVLLRTSSQQLVLVNDTCSHSVELITGHSRVNHEFSNLVELLDKSSMCMAFYGPDKQLWCPVLPVWNIFIFAFHSFLVARELQVPLNSPEARGRSTREPWYSC